MATRNILHINKLQEFESFLESKGYMIVAPSKNPYEVLRAKKDGDTVVVYKKKNATEHLSTMDKDYHLLREFVKMKRQPSNGDRIRSMSDEELAKFLKNTVMEAAENLFDCDDYEEKYGCTNCTKCYLKWLKRSAED